KILACVSEFARGNFDAPLEKFSGERFFINDTIEEIRSAFKSVTAEIDRFCVALEKGDLAVRIVPDGFTGAYRSIVDSMERALTSLNATISTASQQVQQVAITVEQMSQSSQSLASNSQIASTSADQVSASAEETDSQVKANASAAGKANELVGGASRVANEGKIKIQEMVKAMEGIRTSSQDIAKIIKVIDEIAFQTNLLALNAAVEAARAGQHGRGFAVVAQEVRNLAGRSAKAARETSDYIEDATVRVRDGVRIADEANQSFGQIADDIEKVRTLVRDISVSSEEQARGVAQINAAIGEVAKAALSTSQQADELAASAAEMQAATSSMRQEMDRFRLRKVAPVPAAVPGLDQLSPEILAYLQQLMAGRGQPGHAGGMLGKPNGAARSADHDERGFADF
ncbi:MAG: methyl-accepting chemotaxis protein, partial [Gemmobacter sp.]|nr:methyl-accepting chemotaxis protein [Gemmobacter sp.]